MRSIERSYKKAPGQVWLCIFCRRFWCDDVSVSTMTGGTDVKQDPHGSLVCVGCERRLVLYNRGERS